MYKIYKNITELLISRDWEKQEVRTKYDVFVPPLKLGFSGSYKKKKILYRNRKMYLDGRHNINCRKTKSVETDNYFIINLIKKK